MAAFHDRIPVTQRSLRIVFSTGRNAPADSAESGAAIFHRSGGVIRGTSRADEEAKIHATDGRERIWSAK